MDEFGSLLERSRERFPAPDMPLEDVLRRRDRRQRDHRLAAGVVGVAIAILAVLVGTSVIRTTSRPLDHPSPAPVTPAPPAAKMHNGPIDVFGFTGGLRSLTADGAGRLVVRCQGSCTEVVGADWSRDGSRLAFVTTCGGGCASFGDPYHGVRVVDPDLGTDELILPGEGFGPLAWSPDGSRIAYWNDRRLFVMNADGSEQTAITEDLDVDNYPSTPAWSPGGTRFAFSTREGVFVVGLDGSEPAFVVNGSYPAWSPDGGTIAYLVGCEIRLTSPDGRDDAALVDLASGPGSEVCDAPADLEWSPNGAKLAALVDRNLFSPTIPSSRAVFVVDLGGDARSLSSWSRSHDIWGLTWQPVP